MNPLADELNKVLDDTVASRLLSDLGHNLYFPKGIIAQSTEAKKMASFANGTIGMAYSKGQPLILSAISDNMAFLSPEESVAYAPTAGVEKTRVAWKDMMIKKNPSLSPQNISLPVVVPGLTSGLSCTADLFISEGSTLITSDPCWDNYSLIFELRRQANLILVDFFGDEQGLDLDKIAAAIEDMAKSGKVRILFNFPNNPSGYSPTREEEEALVSLIYKAAEKGSDVLVICDDAYFGLFYEDNISEESLFVRFANIHDRVLAIKIDGPIKEDYVWGLRMGFLTIGSKNLDQNHYEALNKKLMGAIRSSISSSNTSAQHLMLRVMDDPRTTGEKKAYKEILARRYNLVKAFIKDNPNHKALKPMPFNSGYFMCFRTNVNAEIIRQELLNKYGIGVIALGDHCLRVAFSSIDEDKITSVFRHIYDCAASLY